MRLLRMCSRYGSPRVSFLKDVRVVAVQYVPVTQAFYLDVGY